jgi:hypothetical protein
VAPAAKPVAPNHPDWAGPPAAPAAPPAHAPHPDWAGPPAVPAAAPPAPPAPPARPAPPPPAATPRPAPPPAAAPAVEPVIDNLGPALSRDLQARSRAKLECTGGPMSGRMFMLSPGVYRVGKSPKDVTGHKTIVITGDKFISKDHATITVDSQKIAIEDPGSTNGSFVNGEKISNAVVKTGDMLRFGETIFRLTVTGS